MQAQTKNPGPPDDAGRGALQLQHSGRREYQKLLKQYTPTEVVNHTSFEEFVGAKVLVEGLRCAGPYPTRAKVVKALETMSDYDAGGITVGYSPTNRIGSLFVEVTVVSGTGRLMK